MLIFEFDSRRLHHFMLILGAGFEHSQRCRSVAYQSTRPRFALRLPKPTPKLSIKEHMYALTVLFSLFFCLE